ncbi:MAG: PAS domain-containing sensor histidine kinase, partial [Bdellovibrionales bacterium]|nr:PAS domain-containing sensor histidine kinase [Bdellovibrionales bacterium]
FILKSFETDFRELLRLSLSRVYSSIQIERERKQLQTAIENSDEGLALLDRSGRVRYGNRAFAQFAHACGGEPTNLLSLLAERVENVETLKQQLRSKLQDLSFGGVWTGEIQLSGKDCTAFSLTLSGLAREGALGPVASDESFEGNEVVAWVRDISELKRRERFQRELISTTTHDLKGPMGAIITGSELIGNLIKDNTRASDILLRVKSSAHGVVNLIDEFLSARRVEDGSLILKPREHPFSTLVSELQDNFQTIADSRSITLTFDSTPDATCTVDKMGFLRVVGNLMSNALKFTPSGGSVSVRGVTLPNGDMQIEVCDSGAGIEPGDLSRIFERYGRLDKHQEVSGTGIGLFVVRSIVQAHGGGIEVDSLVGKGTTFTIRFPKHPPVNERGELISLDFAE